MFHCVIARLVNQAHESVYEFIVKFLKYMNGIEYNG